MAIVDTVNWPHDLLTLDDWERLDLDEGHRVECAEGVLVVAPKPALRHQMVTVQLVTELNRQLPESLTAVPDVDVLLTMVPLTVRAPDVVVVPTRVFAADPPRLTADAVRLIVEVVSSGSRRTDQVTKLSEYADAGIAEYWILDGDPLTLSAYSLESGSYRLVGEFRGIADLAACGTPVRVDLDALARR